MSRSKMTGVLLCIVATVAAVVFVWGIAVQSYWAVALPVAVGFLAVMALVFWIGWTMGTEAPMEAVKEKPDSASPPQSQKT